MEGNTPLGRPTTAGNGRILLFLKGLLLMPLVDGAAVHESKSRAGNAEMTDNGWKSRQELLIH
jgi:hypothetical protein